MGPLLPEFDPERGGRLWIAVGGDRASLTALAGEVRATGALVRENGTTLTALMPPAPDLDRLLAEMVARIERVNAAGDRDGVAVLETRIVPPGGEGPEGPVRIGGRFRIAPAGGDYAADAETILLAASGVFGSGFHPSTRLVVRALDELAGAEPFPAPVLDVGTGSGLLAMIAARQGAAAALGIDIAPEAVAAARENVAINGLGKHVRIEATPLRDVGGLFHLILANLTASVQLRLADELRPRLAAGGELIVSGLLGRQEEEMASFWQKRGLRVMARYGEGRWRALRLRL